MERTLENTAGKMNFYWTLKKEKPKQGLKIQYQNTEISFVKEYVYLGNTVDSNLRMNTQRWNLLGW